MEIVKKIRYVFAIPYSALTCSTASSLASWDRNVQLTFHRFLGCLLVVFLSIMRFVQSLYVFKPLVFFLAFSIIGLVIYYIDNNK